MKYDVIVVGAGISGLTAASLLSKRGLKVAVIEKSYNPGGSCGIFKRNNVIFDQGSAMLYGFGEKGFNPHRFVFNCLEEPINMIKHDLLYCVNYEGRRVRFWPDVEKFSEEMADMFPSEKENIKRFYKDLNRMYQHVMVEHPVFSAPDENDGRQSLKGVLKHPVSYAKFLSYMNKSTKSLLEGYFKDPEIFKFFNKLTSTYCYTNVEETPAILSAIMFVDNHTGGSYYPAGSTIFLPGKLEKVIEENGGDMLLGREATKVIFKDGKPAGVELDNVEALYADNLVYSGTVWNLYGKLIGEEQLDEKQRELAKMVPTYASAVLYAYVDRSVIPEGTLPIEMIVGNPDQLDESEITAYIMSIDDRTLCPEDVHVVEAIGPSFEKFDRNDREGYLLKKEKEKNRLLDVLEERFPGFRKGARYAEVATPLTIERYTNKNGGSVAGPKQMLGQHMFNRLHTKTRWDSLYCCGESTVMGTGTPAVTVSGISAANAVLKKMGLPVYSYRDNMKNYVKIVEKPFMPEDLFTEYPEEERSAMLKARECQYCEHPSCMNGSSPDIRGIMRRVTVGNFSGAEKLLKGFGQTAEEEALILSGCQERCIRNVREGKPVEIAEVIKFVRR
jgi:prolycopene isomerase